MCWGRREGWKMWERCVKVYLGCDGERCGKCVGVGKM